MARHAWDQLWGVLWQSKQRVCLAGPMARGHQDLLLLQMFPPAGCSVKLLDKSLDKLCARIAAGRMWAVLMLINISPCTAIACGTGARCSSGLLLWHGLHHWGTSGHFALDNACADSSRHHQIALIGKPQVELMDSCILGIPLGLNCPFAP